MIEFFLAPRAGQFWHWSAEVRIPSGAQYRMKWGTSGTKFFALISAHRARPKLGGFRPLWVRLHEKGGKYHEITCQHILEASLREYIEAAGISTPGICNHSFRGTGITAYLENPQAKLEHAQQMAAHEDPKTTMLYDRRSDEVSLDEVERIGI